MGQISRHEQHTHQSAYLPTSAWNPIGLSDWRGGQREWHRRNDGRSLNVERDWHGTLGGVSCGPEAVLLEPNPEAIALRNATCAVAAEHLFNHILTPSYDEAHRNHLHADIKRDAREIEIR